jgi:hypothetical protein
MRNHERTERSTDAGFYPEGLATALSLGVTIGPGFAPGAGRGWPVLLVAAVVALVVLLGLIWLYRARSTRRWKAALDAYAAREVARDRGRTALPL